LDYAGPKRGEGTERVTKPFDEGRREGPGNEEAW